jgi:hypothetical protein
VATPIQRATRSPNRGPDETLLIRPN